MSHVPNYTTSYSQFPRGKSPNSITVGQCFWQWVMQLMTSMGSSSALTVSSGISRIIQSLCATCVVPAGSSNSSCWRADSCRLIALFTTDQHASIPLNTGLYKVPNVSLAHQDLLQQFPLLCNVLGALSITTASSLWAIPLILHALTISCIATVGSPPSGFLAGLYNKQSRSFVQWHQLYVSFGL